MVSSNYAYTSTDVETAQADSEKANVRFKDDDEEIDPMDSIPEKQPEDMSPEAKEQIKNLAMTLQKSRLQENRMANFAYEPVSMPPSRVRRTSSVIRYSRSDSDAGTLAG